MPPANDPSQGPADLVALQERLAVLGYDVGVPDGQLGYQTAAAIMAFQKVQGLARSGQVSAELTAAVARASRPTPMAPGGEPTRIEIDLSRQVLFFWQGGSLARILPVSSGSGQRYCSQGTCQLALTPPGMFRIGRKYPGLEVGPLGPLYWPMYFNGGIAVHGSPSVPASPASHGCVRIPMYAARSFYDQVAPGTAVYVIRGTR